MTQKDSPPHWTVDGKTVLGWKTENGYQCLECALERGLDHIDRLSTPGFTPIVQEANDIVYHLEPCASCGEPLREPN